MNTVSHIAKHLRQVYFGGNWTASNLKDQLKDVTWQQATTHVYDLNTIAVLVYHLNYYIHEDIKVLQGQPLRAKDEYSFSHPPIESQKDWDAFLETVWQDGETFAQLIEKLPHEQLWEDFVDPKYYNYYRNLQGIVEHVHYHLGQIVLVKKIIQQQSSNATLDSP